MYTCVPDNRAEFKNQKELYKISDNEFENLFEPCKPKGIWKVIRIIQFIVFFGWLRLILTILGLLVFFVAITIIPVIEPFFETPKKFKYFAQKALRPITRTVLFFIGVIWVNNKGKVDPETRTLVVNHLSVFDTVCLISFFPFGIVSMDSLRGNIFVDHIVRVFDGVFVDRSKSSGTTQKMIEFQNDHTHIPLLVFPEGKVTDGSGLLGFRSGAFIANQQIQPVTIRYKMWLTNKKMSNIAWLEWDALLYVFQLFAVPFITIELDILDPIKFDENKPARDRAIEVEILMANHLGCKAIDRTNKEIFQSGKPFAPPPKKED